MSLRRRLTLAYVGFFAIALIVLDIGLYLVVRQTLLNNIDDDLQHGAEFLQQDFTQSNETLRALSNERLRSFFDNNSFYVLSEQSVNGFDATNLIVQVYQANGELVATSPNVQQPIPIDRSLLTQALANQEIVCTINIGPAHMRQRLQPLLFRDQVVGVLQITRSMKETDLALKLLLYTLLVGGLIVLITAARGGDWLTRAMFKPIDEVTQTAQSIVRAEDLSRRVPVPPVQDELQRLTVTVNDLLARLEGLFSAQRRFVADVSHELRTPLAAMQGNLEVLNRGAARDPELLNESLADMRREVARLIRMTNDLLLLAKSESGTSLRHEPVELDTLLLEVHRELRALANGIQLQIGEEDQIVVQGDSDRIKQALLNLGVNAIQHTPPNGIVRLSLTRRAGFAALTVSDNGSGITSDDLPYIFDRFYRADRSRSRHQGGAGLGLAIVKWITEAHGGQIEVTSTPGVGSQFTLLLPLEPGTTTERLQFVHEHTAIT